MLAMPPPTVTPGAVKSMQPGLTEPSSVPFIVEIVPVTVVADSCCVGPDETFMWWYVGTEKDYLATYDEMPTGSIPIPVWFPNEIEIDTKGNKVP
jgi:hypothetical protein